MSPEGTATSRWDWPDELDAIVAAPGNHQVLLENDRVRVIHTTVAIGATTPLHTHRWPSVEYVLSATYLVRGDGEGTVVFDPGAARGVASVGSFVGATVPPHSVENVGDTELRVVMVELEDRR